jgi:uncharacterized protein YcfJ
VSRVSHAAPAFSGRPAGTVVGSVLVGCTVVGFLVGSVLGAGSGGGEDGEPTVAAAASGAAWDGPVAPVTVAVVEASCQSGPSRDASGARVTYDPEFAVDGQVDSAWRCAGDGVGETLVIDLGGSVRVAELGLVPGYAKTDASDGTDRYAENRRLTAVRWRFDDGTTIEQELDPDPELRDLQTIRIPVATSQRVAMEIVSSSDADRNTVAISELQISAAA